MFRSSADSNAGVHAADHVHEYGTYSLRADQEATGNLRAGRILLGHSRTENTVRYLIVETNDAITLAKYNEV
jgi:hypothetical protein